MSRIKIIDKEGDYWIFPREEIRAVRIESHDNKIKLVVTLSREDKPHTITFHYYSSSEFKNRSYSGVMNVVRKIRDSLDPFNVDTNILWSTVDGFVWEYEENK